MKKSKLLSILSLVIVMIMSIMITACGGGEPTIKEIKMDSTTLAGEYVVGEVIDYSNIQVIVVYDDNSTSTYKLTDADVTYTPIDTSSAGTKELKVTVKGVSVTTNVKVNPALSSIEVFSGLAECEVDDVIDYSKIILKAVYGDESEAFISLTTQGVTYNQIDTTSAGTKTLNIEYQGKTTSLTIIVKAKIVLESIEIFNAKTSYALNEDIDYASIIIKATYSNDTESYINLSTQGVIYNQIDTSTAGEKTLTVEYQGKTTQLVVNVNEPTVKSVEVVEGLKAEYNVGEVLNASEIKLEVVKDDADSTVEYVFLNDADVAYSLDLTSQGTKVLSITYGGVTITKTVSVIAVLQKIEFKVSVLHVVYKDNIDLSTILITAVYNDANVNEDIALNSSEVTIIDNVDTATLGEQTLKVSYQGKVAELTVVVDEPPVASIEVESGIKAEYYVGGELNANEIKIKVIKGEVNVIEQHVFLNDESVTYSVDLTSQGEKTLSISCGGKTITLTINVVAVLQKIQFNYPNGLVFDYKSTVDYSEIFVTAIYNDANANEQIALTDDGVQFNQINTFEEGKHTLTVTYQGKETSIQVEVKKANAIKVRNISLPQSYIDFKDASAVKDPATLGDSDFAIRGKSYVVGSVNKFKFLPEITYVDPNEGLVLIENPITTYVLQLKGNNGEYTTVDSQIYIESAVNNMYKFSDEAVGKEFKLIVSPDVEIYDLSRFDTTPTATIEFKVEKAYNVYDVYGLSVMDNLNVKNWAKIKDRTLIYDDKKLSEYTDVTLIVLHNDISVDADKLPSNYFWTENTPGYDLALQMAKAADQSSGNILTFANRLKGSLRDGTGNGDHYNHTGNYFNSTALNKYDSDGDGVIEDYNESSWSCVNMQKGLFNTNQCSISGNYMTVTTKDSATRTLSSIISSGYVTGNTKKMTNPTPHWSLFKFYKSGTEEVNINLENVFLQGNMPKVNNSGLPAGLMGINTVIDELSVDNIITSQFYTHITCDELASAQSRLSFKNSKMTDAYSNMIYLWRSNVVVENCIMKNAGGPIFILCDGERELAKADEDPALPVLKIDDKSILESYAAGTEAWYSIYDATALFTQLKNMNAMFTNMKAMFKAVNPQLEALACNKTFVHNVNGAEQINLIAVNIPNPEAIMTPRNADDLLLVKGRIERADIEVIDINASPVEVVKSLGSVAFTSGNQFAFMPTTTSIAPFMALAYQGVPGADQVPSNFNNSSDWLSVTMSASSLGATNAPYFNVIISDFTKI